MKTLYQIVTFITLAALATGCAADEDLDVTPSKTAVPLSLLKALEGKSVSDITVNAILEENVAYGTVVKDHTLSIALAQTDKEPPSLTVATAESRVLDPDAGLWENHERIDGSRVFAFQPDSAGEFIRETSTDDEEEEDELMEKDIDDDQLWGDDEEDTDEGKIDITDDQYEDEDEDEDEED